MTELEKYNEATKLILGNRKNRNKAKRILKELSNFPPAQFLLAVLLKGNGKIKNRKATKLFVDALPYYQQTTESDSPERQARLASYFYFGNMGVEQNLQEAVKWFSLSANGGNPQAQLFLSRCYANGYGTEKDIDKCLYWLEKAADQNNAEALTTLGHCYVSGQYVDKNTSKGVDFLKRAIELGDKRALKLYRCLLITKELRDK